MEFLFRLGVGPQGLILKGLILQGIGLQGLGLTVGDSLFRSPFVFGLRCDGAAMHNYNSVVRVHFNAGSMNQLPGVRRMGATIQHLIGIDGDEGLYKKHMGLPGGEWGRARVIWIKASIRGIQH